MPSIYARLGGHDAVKLAVDGLYARVVGDPQLAPSLAGRAIDSHAAHVRPFIAAAFGGPELYRGPDIAAVLAGIGVTNAHFDRTLGHLAAVLADLGADERLIGDVRATLEPLRALVVQPRALPAAA
jgi:hemoglobin